MTLMYFVKRHRYTVINCGVLLVVTAVCVPLLVVVPEARAYAATLLAWTAAFAVRLWRWLPWERASVRCRAHRRADALMRTRGVGSVRGEAKAPPTATTAASWSLLTVAHGGDGGNVLPAWGTPDGDDSGCGWETSGPPLRRKFLQDASDMPSSLPGLEPPKLGREGDVVESCMVTAAAPMLRRAASPPPRISAAALESSSQFLALSTSASPLRSSLPAAGMVCCSHEPFSHVSRRSPLPPGTAGTSEVSTPSLSTIEPDEVATGVAPFPSLSPASSCQTHGYVLPSLTNSPPPSPLFGHDHGAASAASAALSPSSSSAPHALSRLSIAASTAPRTDKLAVVPRVASLDGW